MESRSLQTPASYLPTKKSQLDSQARIAKINELYEKKKKEHRDSVVSNNSTSVVSNNTDTDKCVPIYGLKNKHQNAYEPDEDITTIKRESNESNRYKFHGASAHSSSSPLNNKDTRNGGNNISGMDDRNISIEEEDNYEDDLKFTPKLKSRRSLLISSHLDDNGVTSERDYTERLRRASFAHTKKGRRQSLRKVLGDPLPLPYISATNTHQESKRDTFLSDDTINEKRKLIEHKWRNLISSGREFPESQVQSNKDYSSVNNSISSTMHAPFPTYSLSEDPTDNSVELMNNLKEGILTNGNKLDQIISLLNENSQNNASIDNNNEYYFWVLCIISLIFFNFYVYYYY